MPINQHIKDYLKRATVGPGTLVIILAIGFGIYKGLRAYSLPKSYIIILFDDIFYSKIFWSVVIGFLNGIEILLGVMWYIFVRSLNDKVISKEQLSKITKMAAVALIGAWGISLFTDQQNNFYDTVTLPGFFLVAIVYMWLYINSLLNDSNPNHKK